ncbi:MAG: hypothetical protein A2X08_00995 [Bacteroidetes bacterium GWA2_32_17]|nr:MAG: hypothetical protein A2X08_00995 [Bacteroidetes bacterium GWA2_32_17]
MKVILKKNNLAKIAMCDNWVKTKYYSTNYEKKLYFTYGTANQRVKTEYKNNQIIEKTKYFAGNYEQEIIDGNTRELHYIAGPMGLAAIYVKNNGADSMYYTHTDHLGSITEVTNQNGILMQRMAYNAWGVRELLENNISATYPSFMFDRGYTGHEHLDQFALINMNGRLYDPMLGRFLSPDNFIQSPNFTQSLNRYSYAINNPLKYTDKDGEFFWIPVAIGTAIGAYMGYQAGEAMGYTGWSLVGNTALGALMGFTTSYVGSGISIVSSSYGFIPGIIGGGIAGGMASGATTSFSGGDIMQGFKYGAIVGSLSAFAIKIISVASNEIDFYSGNKEMGINATDPVPPTDEFLNKAQGVWYKDAPMNSVESFTTENVPFENKLQMSLEGAGGATDRIASNGFLTGKSNVYFNKNLAFTSARELYRTMGHEFMHVSQNALLQGLPKSQITKLFRDMLEYHAYTYSGGGNMSLFDPVLYNNTFPNFNSFASFNFGWTGSSSSFRYPF